MQVFKINSEFIPLIQLLKATGIAQSGGEAQIMVEEGLVKVNGTVEHRKRAKLRDGFTVEIGKTQIKISVKS
jgi:ribosome-associated protein